MGGKSEAVNVPLARYGSAAIRSPTARLINRIYFRFLTWMSSQFAISYRVCPTDSRAR